MQFEVTIGIPVFRALDYIGVTMQSALGQTFPSIEFLIIDDCGADGTIEAVELLQRQHPRGAAIRILRNERNLGVGPSRNRIIQEARGKYLYFMDSDDTIELNTIELLVKTIQENKADVVYASYEQIDNVRNTPTKRFVYSHVKLLEEDSLATYAFSHYGSFQSSVCNCLIDLEFLRATKLKFIDAMFWEDMAFTYELVTMVKRAVLLPDITYHYLCRPNSLSNYQDREQLQRDEIMKNVSTIDYLKWKCYKLRGRSFIPSMSYNLQMNSFYIICHVLKYRQRITPPVSNSDLRSIMRPPMPLSCILGFPYRRMGNLVLWFIAHLPLWLFIPTIRLMGRVKKVL